MRDLEEDEPYARACSQRVELNESAGEYSERADDAHCHEDAQEDVIQNHRHKLPLFSRLQPGQRLVRNSKHFILGISACL